ncbi:HNH endonuclease [Nocardioides KLBMP 9356]|uniref:HNH endonuclease n=1 Tax=Nocardioides potassii TaxID=2911371 RepID=A0ABS9HGW6_9ACTN|nr:HNH endonuclease signature motif containing protein [Nocardioides potassii]MCF6379358.1 HNH endonuclease [Nocardioides potassii]
MPSAQLTSIAAVDAWLDQVSHSEAGALSGSEQAALIQELQRIERRVVAARLHVLAAAERSRTATHNGAASTAAWVATLTHADPQAAFREVRLANGVEDSPAVGTSLGRGDISPAHASVIVDASRKLPASITPAQREVVEQTLVEKAQHLSPSRLRKAARRAIGAIEPDATVVDAHEDALLHDEEAGALARTSLTFHDNQDGTVSGRFTLPTLQGHLLRKVIETMTAPRRGRLGASQAHTGPKPEIDWDHARGLAFAELVEHIPTDHLHPAAAATLLVTIDETGLRDRLRAAHLDTGDRISAGEARRLACSAGIMPAVLGTSSIPVDLGRQSRLFTGTQRTGLASRHHTCAADGCERPYSWCELHHWDPWKRGGRSDLVNAVPLCHFHHRRVHDTGFLHARLPDGSIRFSRRT